MVLVYMVLYDTIIAITCVYTYIYIYIYIEREREGERERMQGVFAGIREKFGASLGPQLVRPYTRSPSLDFRLFGPRPWKILATTYEKKRFLSNPDPCKNLVSGNLVMETGRNSSTFCKGGCSGNRV